MELIVPIKRMGGMELTALSNSQLRDRLRQLAGGERRLVAELLRHLALADARHAERGWGFPSLFYYCTEELRYSEAAAYKRIQAARLCASFPKLLEMLERGETNLSVALLLRPHLTVENEADVLRRVSHKNYRQVETVVAALAPRPDVPDSVRRAAIKEPCPVLAQTPDGPAASPAPKPARVEILSPGRFHLNLTVSQAVWEKIERVRGLLRGRHPGGELEKTFDELAEHFLRTRDPMRRALRRSETASQRGPQALRDAVILRDGGRCTFTSPDGRRCRALERLEADHIVPKAKGGGNELSNLRTLCRSHNQLAAEEIFGRALVGPHRRGRGR